MHERLLIHHFLGALVAVPMLSLAHRRHVDDLANPARPARHHDDAIRQIDRLVDRVRDEQHRTRVDARQLDQLFLHDDARLRIERAERLVHQQHVRIEHIAAGDGDALLHAARELMRICGLIALQSHQFDLARDALAACRLGETLAAQSEVDILAHGLPGEQRELLEHDGAVRPRPGHRPATDADGARRRKLEAGGHPQARRLAASRRADDRNELAVAHLEADAFERGERLAIAVEDAADAVEHDVAHRVIPRKIRRRRRSSGR